MKDNNLENTQKNSHLYEIIDVPQATGVNVPHFRGRGKLHPDALAPVLSRSSIFLKENWK